MVETEIEKLFTYVRVRGSGDTEGPHWEKSWDLYFPQNFPIYFSKWAQNVFFRGVNSKFSQNIPMIFSKCRGRQSDNIYNG